MRECQKCKQCFPDVVTICPEDGQPTFRSIDGNPILEGKYRLEKRLGQGGMGVVYCARHIYLKSQYAVKIILPDLVGNDPQLVTRFRQEALAAAAIRHHNVVSVTDYGVVQETTPFLVMEYVEGESLQELLAREKRLSPERAVELMSAIGSGVSAAHRQGIVHRDLKPLNIMICEDKPNYAEGVKILDFGLAKIKSSELLGSFIQAQTTGLMGSPYYMAPEQWADEEPDVQADIYSLGVIMYQILAGDVPFKGSSIPAIMKKHLSDAPKPFSEACVEVPPGLEAAVFHALEKTREKRTKTVSEMLEEFRISLGQSQSSIHNTQNPAANRASTIHVLTGPPQSKVFINNVPVGETQTDGWLLLEGVRTGNHHLRISKEGFKDWENQILCDGTPQQVVARLAPLPAPFPPQSQSENVGQHTQPVSPHTPSDLSPQINSTQNVRQNFSDTGRLIGQTSQSGQTLQNTDTSQSGQSQPLSSVSPPPVMPAQTAAPAGKSGIPVSMIAIAGIVGLLAISAIVGLIAWKTGFFGGATGETANKIVTTTNPHPTPSVTASVPVSVKNEMISIPGGKFVMGSNSAGEREKPEREVEVKNFAMDKTEVTNAEYYEFVKAEKYTPPSTWKDGKPLSDTEMLPVSLVSLNDAKAFAAWRSKRDGVQYRLPTEEEWEYAARNGAADNLYPWGDTWEDNRAVLGVEKLKPVGSVPSGANRWGVLDLLGNVSEWTSSEFKPYPGGKFAHQADVKNPITTRGGSFRVSASPGGVTSVTRNYAPLDYPDERVGFRLVRSE